MDAMIGKSELLSLIRAYPPEQRYALAILQDMQRKYTYLPRLGLSLLSEYLEQPLAPLYAMATFYRSLSLKPKGRHIIKCCDGTACHLKGAARLVDEIGKQLGIAPGETAADGLFSLETVNCLGACAMAPVLLIDDDYYGQVNPEKLKGILARYQEGGGADG